MNDQNVVAVKLTDNPRQRNALNNMPQKAKLALHIKTMTEKLAFQ